MNTTSNSHNQVPYKVLNGEPPAMPRRTYTTVRDAYAAWLERRRSKGTATALMQGSYHRKNK